MPVDDIARTNSVKSASLVRALAVWGPGLLVMLADTDAGNVVTGAQAGRSGATASCRCCSC